MIEIVQAPQSFNFSLSLPDFVVSSDQPVVEMRVSDADENVIVAESYDMPPNGQDLVIKLSKLIDMLLTSTRPTVGISLDPNVVQTFKVEFDDFDDLVGRTITVVKGYEIGRASCRERV